MKNIASFTHGQFVRLMNFNLLSHEKRSPDTEVSVITDLLRYWFDEGGIGLYCRHAINCDNAPTILLYIVCMTLIITNSIKTH